MGRRVEDQPEMMNSPACAMPVWMARLISGCLNSDAPECTVITSLPPVAAFTSAANCSRFLVWKVLAP